MIAVEVLSCIAEKSLSLDSDFGVYVFMDIGSSGHILFGVHKYCSPLDDGEYASQQFIANDIYDRHIGFALGCFAPIVLSQLRIEVYCTYSGQMQHLFHLLIGDGTDLCFAMDAGAGTIFKRCHAGIAGELSPLVKSCKITGVDDEMSGNNQPDALDGCYQLDRSPEFGILNNDIFHRTFDTLDFHMHSGNHGVVRGKQFRDICMIDDSLQFVSATHISSMLSSQLIS